MKRLVRRAAVTVASAAIVGGAVLGAGGTASAATASEPVEHVRSSVAGSGADGGRDGYHTGGYGYGRYGDEGREDRWGWYANDGDWDSRHGWYVNGDHHGWHHKRVYRWDGHRLYVSSEGRWIDVTPLRNGSVDGWYVDQLLEFQH